MISGIVDFTSAKDISSETNVETIIPININAQNIIADFPNVENNFGGLLKMDFNGIPVISLSIAIVIGIQIKNCEINVIMVTALCEIDISK